MPGEASGGASFILETTGKCVSSRRPSGITSDRGAPGVWCVVWEHGLRWTGRCRRYGARSEDAGYLGVRVGYFCRAREYKMGIMQT